MKAQVARNYWKNEGWYSVLISVDNQVEKALTLFQEARDLAKHEMKLRIILLAFVPFIFSIGDNSFTTKELSLQFFI
ncbi:MAG: hypothetical protein MZV64_37850 [Ignavibacteriales bacterium]|nr:hypothetical protein [Ignavibacteriales bacterium]